VSYGGTLVSKRNKLAWKDDEFAHRRALPYAYGPTPRVGNHRGLGSWTSVITAGLQTGLAVTTMIYQERMAARQHKIERHKRERAQAAEAERQRQAAAAAAELAKQQQVQSQIAANATGGAVAVDAHGRPLPASGIAAAIPGGSNVVLIGLAGIAVIGLIAFVGRR